MRRIFIGDIQGCIEECEALLERLVFDPSSDRLFLVGDLIGRGPSGAKVLRLIRSLCAGSVLGNHEAHLLDRGLFDPGDPGGEDWGPLQDLARAPDRLELGAWLRERPLLLPLADILLVHAAVPPPLWDPPERGPDPRIPYTGLRHPFEGAEAELCRFILSARYCDPEGRLPPREEPPPPPPFEPWDRFYRGPWTVVFGHWARRGRFSGGRLRGLDSGCVYGGSLTAWIAEEDRFVQVPARRAWFP